MYGAYEDPSLTLRIWVEFGKFFDKVQRSLVFLSLDNFTYHFLNATQTKMGDEIDAKYTTLLKTVAEAALLEVGGVARELTIVWEKKSKSNKDGGKGSLTFDITEDITYEQLQQTAANIKAQIGSNTNGAEELQGFVLQKTKRFPKTTPPTINVQYAVLGEAAKAEAKLAAKAAKAPAAKKKKQDSKKVTNEPAKPVDFFTNWKPSKSAAALFSDQIFDEIILPKLSSSENSNSLSQEQIATLRLEMTDDITRLARRFENKAYTAGFQTKN